MRIFSYRSNNIYLCIQAIQDTPKRTRVNNRVGILDSMMRLLKSIAEAFLPEKDAKDLQSKIIN